jgi:class 3 adenylate cyclase
MSAKLDEAFLDERLAVIEKARSWSPRVVSKLELLLHTDDDAALCRVNPLSFAAERGLSEREAIDLFLHAAKAGLFTMGWHLLCPACGMAVESFDTLRAIHMHSYCALCLAPTVAQLDDYIQVSFTVSPRVRTIAHHDPASLPITAYLAYRLTRETLIHEGGPPLASTIIEYAKAALWLAPGEQSTAAFEVEPGTLVITELAMHAGVQIEVAGAPSALVQALTVTIAADTPQASVQRLSPGPAALTVTNATTHRLPVIAVVKPADIPANVPAYFNPFLRGSAVLANQTFRQLFRGEVIQADGGIGVRDVTILFTDLKSSTQLYERVGDLRAFELVRRHFDGVAGAIAANGGAVVKTIGDAVMAVFNHPRDAVAAALAMQDAIDAFNRDLGERDIILKIGVHRGPSIAVTLNENLDYFGQTVNIAARVQGLAEADEICVTDDVYSYPGVPALLERASITPQDAQLRGIQKEVRVYRAVRSPC